MSKIDDLIARCSFCDDAKIAREIQTEALSLLENLGCSYDIILSCRKIDFGEDVKPERINMGHLGYAESKLPQICAFDYGMKVMTDVLKEARTILERKDNQKLQRQSMIYAAIAAFGTLLSIGITLFLHFI